ncbi:hypothetical protein F5Y13DRAFT_45920 [Hypoxylon sp. FL1857]|nr:hypothetical protein F5Y13DRAFT_45920 [Hypoxylon sp. FL1857]
MSTSTQSPKTMMELQAALRLKYKSDAEALIKAEPVKEAFRKYMNRCLSSGSTTKQLPDWKDVHEHLMVSRPARGIDKTLNEIIEQQCTDNPYELMPHVSMFALRIMEFIKSAEGEVFDISLEDHPTRRPGDVQFDRCRRIMDLLAFLVNQHREMKKKNTETKREPQIQEKPKGNWI